MKKKDLVFILGLTLLMGVIWVVGELVMGLWIAVFPTVLLVWRIGIVVVTLVVSVWHSMLEDKSEEKNPRQAKYEKKTKKRKKK